jgi:hypothetical protein
VTVLSVEDCSAHGVFWRKITVSVEEEEHSEH